MEISKAKESDYPELIDVWEDSVRATHDFLSGEDILRLRHEMASRYLPAVELYVVRDEADRIRAFIGLVDDYIAMLFVRPDCRGKGVGRYVAEWAIGEKGARRVDVNEQNGQAVGFYYKLGFSLLSRSDTDDRGEPFPILHLGFPG